MLFAGLENIDTVIPTHQLDELTMYKKELETLQFFTDISSDNRTLVTMINTLDNLISVHNSVESHGVTAELKSLMVGNVIELSEESIGSAISSGVKKIWEFIKSIFKKIASFFKKKDIKKDIKLLKAASNELTKEENKDDFETKLETAIEEDKVKVRVYPEGYTESRKKVLDFIEEILSSYTDTDIIPLTTTFKDDFFNIVISDTEVAKINNKKVVYKVHSKSVDINQINIMTIIDNNVRAADDYMDFNMYQIELMQSLEKLIPDVTPDEAKVLATHVQNYMVLLPLYVKLWSSIIDETQFAIDNLMAVITK